MEAYLSEVDGHKLAMYEDKFHTRALNFNQAYKIKVVSVVSASEFFAQPLIYRNCYFQLMDEMEEIYNKNPENLKFNVWLMKAFDELPVAFCDEHGNCGRGYIHDIKINGEIIIMDIDEQDYYSVKENQVFRLLHKFVNVSMYAMSFALSGVKPYKYDVWSRTECKEFKLYTFKKVITLHINGLNRNTHLGWGYKNSQITLRGYLLEKKIAKITTQDRLFIANENEILYQFEDIVTSEDDSDIEI